MPTSWLESVIRQPGNYSLSNMTLHFWIGTEDSAYETGMIAGILLNPTMWKAVGRQVLLALSVALIVGTSGMLIGYACVRRRGTRLSRYVESLAFFSYLMPAMAFGTIYLAVATSENFKWLYGTFGLLVLVSAVKFLPIQESGAVEGHVYSTLPTGMETTVKVTCGDTMLTSVVFGNVDYPVDMPIRLAINGDGLMLFDQQSGNAVGQGSVIIG